jgi:hypothetical protein
MTRLLRYESLMWTSLFRWVTRRPLAGPAGVPFGYGRAITPVMWVFVAVSGLEIPIVDLLLPWPVARIAADVLGVYGLLWMIGALAMLRVHPHVVDPAGLRVRTASGVDLEVPWDHIATVRAAERTVEGRGPQIDRTGAGPVLCIPVMKATNVEIAFAQSTILELPAGDTEPVRGLRIGVDEPAAMVAAIRPHLTRQSAPARPT